MPLVPHPRISPRAGRRSSHGTRITAAAGHNANRRDANLCRRRENDVTRKKKILLVIAAIVMLAVASGAFILSHDSPCRPAAPLAADVPRMHAVMHRCYGGSESLSYEEIARPVPGDDEVLIKVHAASVNPYDWHYMTGKPYIMRLGLGIGAPEAVRMGVDFAGTVETVGRDVKRFKPGDAVFGGASGAFAEYLSAHAEGSIAHKPPELSFQDAAALPVAALTALQALRDEGRLQAGQKVLINGASGGVGTYAVQIAKAMGAHVTGVCSTRNVELVRSLGADAVIDYTQDDVTRSAGRYHLILDNVGNHSFHALRKVLEPKGILVQVGGPKGPWIDPLLPIVKGVAMRPFVDEEFRFFMARFSVADLEALASLARDGKLRSVIGKTYSLREVPAALDLVGTRHARGKVVVQVGAAP
jgi:NADPH:quinone reductase-like Zn-dependent oxidoreductase